MIILISTQQVHASIEYHLLYTIISLLLAQSLVEAQSLINAHVRRPEKIYL